MENKKEMTLRKLPLKVLIETLVGLYEGGADFVDISGIPDEVQDIVTISVKGEYFSKGKKEGEEGEEEYDIEEEFEDDELYDDDIKEEDKDLSDDDLNQLL